MRTRWVLTTSVSEDNVDSSSAERRIKKLEDKKLELTGLRQKYDYLINMDADTDVQSNPKDIVKSVHPANRGRQDRSNDLAELRNGIGDEPLPENVIPIFKPGIETNGYKK